MEENIIKAGEEWGGHKSQKFRLRSKKVLPHNSLLNYSKPILNLFNFYFYLLIAVPYQKFSQIIPKFDIKASFWLIIKKFFSIFQSYFNLTHFNSTFDKFSRS